MAELLKNRYNKAYIARLAAAVHAACPQIDRDAFTRAVLGKGWAALELKQRMRRIAETLHAFVPGTYAQQLAVLRKAAPGFSGFEAMFFPEFVERFGMDGPDDFKRSVDALEYFTQFSSSEFAVRPFIARYGADMMTVMQRWTAHDNEHVRRLASEGCRPRLPWGMRLPQFIADPAPLLPILETLRNDSSDYVRRSVANNLNDIAKDHPAVVLAIAQRWLGRNANTDKLVKHACRTLLKRGDQRALKLFGHHDAAAIKLTGLRLSAAELRIGDRVSFNFSVTLDQPAAAHVRIEYAIDFVKANGSTTRKVFKIKEAELQPRQPLRIERKHRLTDFTTRKHYPGRHTLSIIVNGIARAQKHFLLRAAEE